MIEIGLASFNNHRRQQGEWASVVDHHGEPPQPSESDATKMAEELDGEERPARKSRTRSKKQAEE